MRAVAYTRYGAPSVLALTTRDKPEPKDDQVLVRVQGVSLNPLEWHHVRGKPFPLRFSAGLFAPKPEIQIQGTDVAGVVESVGSAVTRFKAGDHVFGAAPMGALADFVAVGESSLEMRPTGFSAVEAACLPVAGATALLALRDSGKLAAGDRVLVNGSSGGVGYFSVQIAKALGAKVTAVCSTRNLEMVRAAGADEVIDYTQTDVSALGARFDLVVDNAGSLALKAFGKLLAAGGRGVVVGYTSLARIAHIGLAGQKKGRNVKVMMADVNAEVLSTLKTWADEGKVRPVIDKTWPLEKTAEALAYLEGYHARGKVVVEVSK